LNLKVTAKNLQGVDFHIRLDDLPDVCPICHRSVHPTNIINQYLVERELAQAVFRCTSQQCQEIFIATYKHSGHQQGMEVFRLSTVAPKEFKPLAFPKTIIDVSPTFAEVYNQALAAEAFGLTEILGIGLRKFLEFLIKDFAISRNKEAAEEIKNMFLGKCIETYINDLNVKECAKRAAWLGNDETHYIKKWEDKDVNDLKTLIRLTVNWIENVLLTEEYISSMTTA
jgi:hypothetical protein